MKKILLVLLALLSLTTQAQWQSLPSPGTGSTSHIWASNNKLYILTSNNMVLARSEDNGSSWTNILDLPYSFNPSRRILFKGDSILLYQNGFHRSLDAGNTWSFIPANMDCAFFNVRGRTIAITDSSNQLPYKILRTDDWGITWNETNYAHLFNTQEPSSNRMAQANDRLYFIDFYNNLHIDVDSSDFSINSSGVPHSVNLWAEGTSMVYTNFYNTTYYVSRNSGFNWDTIQDPHNPLTLYSNRNFCFNNDTLFFIYPDSVYYQTTNSVDWYPVNGLPTGQKFVDMIVYNGYYIVTSSLGGIFRSSSINGPWTQITNFGSCSTAKVKEKLNNKFFTSVDNLTISTSEDNFQTFQALSYTVDGLTDTKNFDFFNMDGFLFGVFNDTIVKSTDGGSSWTKLTIANVGVSPLYNLKLIHEGSTLFLSAYYQYSNSNNHFLMSSSDYGATWTVIYGDYLSPASNSYWERGKFMKLGNAFYVTDGYGRFAVRKYIVNNGSVQFDGTLVDQLTPITWLRQVNNVLLGSNTNFSMLYVSFNNGLSWMYGGADLPSGFENAEYYGNGSQIYAYSPGNGVYYSNNNGLNWAAINNNINGAKVKSLNFIDNELYTYTKNQSFWKRTPPNGSIECASGNVYLDMNDNSVFEPSDLAMPNQLVSCYSNFNMVYSQANGSYNSCVQDFINDTIRVSNYNTNIYFDPEFYLVNQTQTDLNFKTLFHTQLNDVRVDLTYSNQAVLNMSGHYYITLTNLGSTVSSGTVIFNFTDQLMIQSVSEAPATVTSSSLIWNYDNLLPTYQKNYNVQVNYPDTILQLGEVLNFEALVQPSFVDDEIANNRDTVSQIVVGSYDPNDKTVNLPKYITPAQVSQKSEMIYTVRFQNTGTWAAQNVFIMDTISANLDMSSFHVIAASHDYNVEFLSPRILKFNFPDINLADSNHNEAASHGFIKYSLRCNNTLQINDSILNTAHIFFDFNVPITTNRVENIVATSIGVKETIPLDFCIIPNPSTERTTIRFGENGVYQIEIRSLDGRLVKSEKVIGNAYSLNTSQMSSGVYLVKLISGSKMSCKKLMVK